MNFRTQIPLESQQHNEINYKSQLLLFGSCFSEHIAEKLGYYKFSSQSNPFGIFFHPKAIENLVLNAINKKLYAEDEIFYNNEQWHCFDAHSRLSHPDKALLLENLNTTIQSTFQQIQKASHCIITLGTAWAYREIASDSFVANCHKLPQKKFLKELLPVKDISESISATVALIKSVNPNCSFIFTVSPVRHLKDGFVENMKSKAHLITAVHELIDPRNDLHYFPAFEILLDELRDYRFYAEDMLHPNPTAINYIWERFTYSWISKSARETMQEIEIIQKGLSHKPFNPNTEQHEKFLDNLQNKILQVQKDHPTINFRVSD